MNTQQETMCVFGVAAAVAFIEKRYCHVFGYGRNIIFCLWDP
jgi:hypothetical protein